MRIVIVGCGRVGAALAETFDVEGHEVVVLDVSTAAFDRLPSTFRGSSVRGDGTDEDVLRRAGAEGADLFLALTEGDNRNVMAAQVAAEELGAAKVVAKINDPVRAEAYADLGIATLCRTNLLVDAVRAFVDLPALHPAGVMAATGYHPGGEHHAVGSDESSVAPPATTPPTSAAATSVAAGEG